MSKKSINIGNVKVGEDGIVSIQSMTNTPTDDIIATSAQIAELAKEGCDIVRVAVPDFKAVDALSEIIKQSPIPVIADIHFDYKLAIGAIKAGIHAIRINPGNIGSAERVKEVAELAKEYKVPIRVGANSGSLPKGLYEENLKKLKNRTEAMAESLVVAALEQCKLLEDCGFSDIKVSLKSSEVPATVKAYRKFAEIADYPLHIGVTEAGTFLKGTVKSAVGIGSLILDGIGDTLRVSLTADPVEEIKIAKLILESVGLRNPQPEIVSCPSCGRTEIGLFDLVDKVENLIENIKASGKEINIKKLAVMGCVVNGPGEAKDAEIGIAGGKGKIAIFKAGKLIGTYSENEGFEKFKEEILKYIK